MSGKQRLKSKRIVRSSRWDAWSCSKSAKGAALPTRGKKHSSEVAQFLEATGRCSQFLVLVVFVFE